MTSQRRNPNKAVFVTLLSISLVGLVYVAVQDSCEVRHVGLLNDIDKHERTPDPDLCYSMLERIENFNDRCGFHLEIPDCG